MVLRWGVFVVLLLAFILVPFMLLEGRMNELVQQTLQSKASLAWITLAVIVFLLADIVLPVPSSFVLTTTGYLLATGVDPGRHLAHADPAIHARGVARQRRGRAHVCLDRRGIGQPVVVPVRLDRIDRAAGADRAGTAPRGTPERSVN